MPSNSQTVSRIELRDFQVKVFAYARHDGEGRKLIFERHVGEKLEIQANFEYFPIYSSVEHPN